METRQFPGAESPRFLSRAVTHCGNDWTDIEADDRVVVQRLLRVVHIVRTGAWRRRPSVRRRERPLTGNFRGDPGGLGVGCGFADATHLAAFAEGVLQMKQRRRIHYTG